MKDISTQNSCGIRVAPSGLDAKPSPEIVGDVFDVEFRGTVDLLIRGFAVQRGQP